MGERKVASVNIDLETFERLVDSQGAERVNRVLRKADESKVPIMVIQAVRTDPSSAHKLAKKDVIERPGRGDVEADLLSRLSPGEKKALNQVWEDKTSDRLMEKGVEVSRIRVASSFTYSKEGRTDSLLGDMGAKNALTRAINANLVGTVEHGAAEKDRVAIFSNNQNMVGAASNFNTAPWTGGLSDLERLISCVEQGLDVTKGASISQEVRQPAPQVPKPKPKPKFEVVDSTPPPDRLTEKKVVVVTDTVLGYERSGKGVLDEGVLADMRRLTEAGIEVVVINTKRSPAIEPTLTNYDAAKDLRDRFRPSDANNPRAHEDIQIWDRMGRNHRTFPATVIPLEDSYYAVAKTDAERGQALLNRVNEVINGRYAGSRREGQVRPQNVLLLHRGDSFIPEGELNKQGVRNSQGLTRILEDTLVANMSNAPVKHRRRREFATV